MDNRQVTTGTPCRIQRRRTKGWRAPADAVYVGRGTKWGNPCTQIRTPALDGTEWERESRLGKTSGQHHGYRHPDGHTTSHLILDATPEQAVAMYRQWIAQRPSLAAAAREHLAGRDLMCWCPPPQPGQPDHCHAAVLLEIANPPAAPAEESTVGPRCGNNPNVTLTDGDRQAVEDFKAYLARRRAGGPPERDPFNTEPTR
ncbi:DUF4326 domain-containing protein [Streptomyces siamensis]